MYRKDQQRRLSKERLYKELLGLDSGLQYKKAELQNAFRDRAKGESLKSILAIILGIMMNLWILNALNPVKTIIYSPTPGHIIRR